MPTSPNAIERCVELMRNHWLEFTENEQARLLIWKVDDDAARMFHLLMEVESDEGGEVPDLFMRFETPMDDPNTYAETLLEAFKEHYAELAEALAEDDITAEFKFPTRNSRETNVAWFIRTVTGFAEYYQDLMEHLCIVLLPTDVSDIGDWKAWLRQCLNCDLPENLRLSVLDGAENAILSELEQSDPVRVVSVKPEVDLPGAYEELAKADGSDAPGDRFREHLTALGNATGKGDEKKAEQEGAAAIKIAEVEKWPGMVLSVYMSLGAMYLGKQETDTAIARYLAAREVAEGMTREGDESGPNLELQSRFAHAAALVSAGRFKEAAHLYRECAPMAEQQENHFLHLEAWRMTAQCEHLNKKAQPAWDAGLCGLDVVAAMDEEGRNTSTTPHLASLLCELGRKSPFKNQMDQVRKRFVELMGPDWETTVRDAGGKP